MVLRAGGCVVRWCYTIEVCSSSWLASNHGLDATHVGRMHAGMGVLGLNVQHRWQPQVVGHAET